MRDLNWHIIIASTQPSKEVENILKNQEPYLLIFGKF